MKIPVGDNFMCPRCGRGRLKNWRELSANEKFHAERMSIGAANVSENELRNRYFCVKCWFAKDENTAEC